MSHFGNQTAGPTRALRVGQDDHAFIAESYDFVVPYTERQDVAFYVEQAVESGGPVLEVGCGIGRVLIPAARAGVKMVGLEVSELKPPKMP